MHERLNGRERTSRNHLEKTKVVGEEATVLEKFRKGTAGKLARVLSLCTLLSFGEGCDSEMGRDQAAEYVKNNPNLPEKYTSLPNIEMFNAFDDIRNSRWQMSQKMSASNLLAELSIFENIREELAGTSSAEEVAKIPKEVTEELKRLATLSGVPTEEEILERGAELGNLYEIIEQVRSILGEQPGLTVKAAIELDIELYAYTDKINGNIDNVIGKDDFIEGYTLRWGLSPFSAVNGKKMKYAEALESNNTN